MWHAATCVFSTRRSYSLSEPCGCICTDPAREKDAEKVTQFATTMGTLD